YSYCLYRYYPRSILTKMYKLLNIVCHCHTERLSQPLELQSSVLPLNGRHKLIHDCLLKCLPSGRVLSTQLFHYVSLEPIPNITLKLDSDQLNHSSIKIR